MDNQKPVLLTTPLPANILPGPALKIKEEQIENISTILKETLPARETATIQQQLNWQMTLDKHSGATTAESTEPTQSRKRKRKRNRNKIVSANTNIDTKPKVKLQIDEGPTHEIEPPATKWNYKELLPVRDMWREYIKKCIGKPVIHLTDKNSSLMVILAKCEFIGASVKVEKCLSSGMVGMSGIVIKETQKVFHIVTEKSALKKIPKNTVVLLFDVGHLQFTVYGKHLMTRPAERSVKKIKSILFADI